MKEPVTDLDQVMTVGFAIHWALERRDRTIISDAIREEWPLTDECRAMLADFIDGKIKMPRGRPRSPLLSRTELRMRMAKGELWRLRLAHGGRLPTGTIETVATHFGMDPETLRNRDKRASRKRRA